MTSYVRWFINMLLESAGGERMFEPIGVCVGIRVEMKFGIDDNRRRKKDYDISVSYYNTVTM